MKRRSRRRFFIHTCTRSAVCLQQGHSQFSKKDADSNATQERTHYTAYSLCPATFATVYIAADWLVGASVPLCASWWTWSATAFHECCSLTRLCCSRASVRCTWRSALATLLARLHRVRVVSTLQHTSTQTLHVHSMQLRVSTLQHTSTQTLHVHSTPVHKHSTFIACSCSIQHLIYGVDDTHAASESTQCVGWYARN